MSKYRDSYAFRDGPLVQLHRWLSWSLYIGRPIAGIPTRLHWSALILPLIFASFFSNTWGEYFAAFFLLAIVLYGSTYLHELGHAITALVCHYPVKEIFLYFLGGLAISMGQRRTPKEDFAIIAFGPMVNFVLVGIAAGLRLLFIDTLGLSAANGYYLGTPLLSLSFFLDLLFWVNLVLGIFNLIPIFPLDGGGMVRALFSLKYHPNKVTVRVATFGQFVVAPLMILYGLVSFVTGGQGGLLVLIIAVLGIVASQHEKMRARHMPIYGDFSGGYNFWAQSMGEPGWGQLQGGGGGYQDSAGTGPIYGGWSDEANESKAKKKGFFAKRRQQKQEKAIEQARLDQSKIDELLEKISRDGIQSLSKKERDFLNSASKRYNR